MNDKFDSRNNRKPAFQQPDSKSRFSPKSARDGEKSEKRFSDNRTSNRTSDRRRSEGGFSAGPKSAAARQPSASGERRERREDGGRQEFRQPRERRDNRERGDNRDRREKRDSPNTGYVWGEREMDAVKAGKHSEGSVKVMIKGEVKGEKKTGALSPRAPEKIRNNRNEEMKVYGEAACLALFRQRPDSIVRLWVTVEVSHRIGKIMSYLANAKKTYHVVDSAELELVSGSDHHGGICMLVKKATPMNLDAYLKTAKLQDCVLVLDGINNAHNLGGIIRTAAYYGVKGIVCESADKFYSAAARVAEGGMEHIYALESRSSDSAIEQLNAAGYQVIALTANKQAQPLNKTVLRDKVAFVLAETVSTDVRPSAEAVVLSFDNPLNSGLNVAVNAGILLSHWYFR
ncbi:TrmH family RNA methyltransferase [Chelonobacter oris]|uniref:TrmH family RNA methyltransferase n=1 Tax=Chelonobacter oris TaxID=505317 RepID=UPI00244AFE63|nr:TrmH family RNA methyltransferase [Chelonobacter oris]